MIPSLATRGRLVLATAVLLLMVGALHGLAPLIAIGGIVLFTLCSAHLVFYATAILLRRRKIELSWWVPPGDLPGGAIAADRAFALHLAFRNHGSRTLRVLGTRILASSAVTSEGDATATVAPGRQVEVAVTARSRRAGYQIFHGARLTFGDALALFRVDAYFPNPIAIKVFPRSMAAPQLAVPPSGATVHEQVGLHQHRRRGLAGELRELRDHSHGDPFKLIAWKATARKNRLMVRDLETEIVATHSLVVDVGGAMRGGGEGPSALDWAIEASSALTRAALDNGDRVGLVTFDTRVVGDLRPGSGRHHFLRLVDRLLDATVVADEDLTDLTAGELVAAVARYLAFQEAFDGRVRTPPPLDDPAWQSIQTGPDGQLYDVAAITAFTRSLVSAATQGHERQRPLAAFTQAPAPRDADPALAQLRGFCRLRGIELPYLAEPDHGRRALGFEQAILRAIEPGRPDTLVIVSSLDGLAENEAAVARALARARRSAGRLLALVPSPTAFAPAATTASGQRVRAILASDAQHRLDASRRLLQRHGVSIVETGPDRLPASLAGRGRGRRAA